MAADVDLKKMFIPKVKKKQLYKCFGAREHDSGCVLIIWIQICIQNSMKYPMFDDCNHPIAHSGNSERNINKICVCIMVKQIKYIKVFYGKNYIYIYIYTYIYIYIYIDHKMFVCLFVRTL